MQSQEQHAAKRPRTQLPSASNASSAAADASLNNLAPHAATVDQQLPPKAATPRNGDFVPGWAAASAQLPAANASFLGAPPQPAMQSAGQHAQASAAAETQLLPKLHSASMAEAGIADDSGAQQKVELPAEATAAVQKQSDQLPAAALTAGDHVSKLHTWAARSYVFAGRAAVGACSFRSCLQLLPAYGQLLMRKAESCSQQAVVTLCIPAISLTETWCTQCKFCPIADSVSI